MAILKIKFTHALLATCKKSGSTFYIRMFPCYEAAKLELTKNPHLSSVIKGGECDVTIEFIADNGCLELVATIGADFQEILAA